MFYILTKNNNNWPYMEKRDVLMYIFCMYRDRDACVDNYR